MKGFANRGASGRRVQEAIDNRIADGQYSREHRYVCPKCNDLGLRYRVVPGEGALKNQRYTQCARCDCETSKRWSEQIASCEAIDNNSMMEGRGLSEWFTKDAIDEALMKVLREMDQQVVEEGDFG